MKRLFQLGSVLRARKAQEDAARGAVVQSRQEVRDAEALVRRQRMDLAGAEAPNEGTARAIVASLMARQSLAASISEARQRLNEAEEVHEERADQLAEAAKRRRTMEMMAERHAAAVRAHDLAVDEKNLEELAMSSKARNAARGIDAVSERRANPLRTASRRPAHEEPREA